MAFVVFILTAFTLSLRPWEAHESGVVQDVLQCLRTGKPCGALSIAGAINHSRIECFQPPGYWARIKSRRSGLWITPREVESADTLFGIPFTILRKEGRRAWVYQPKLDITFAVDDPFLVDFTKGKTTSDAIFMPIAAKTSPTKSGRTAESEDAYSRAGSQHTSTPMTSTASPK